MTCDGRNTQEKADLQKGEGGNLKAFLECRTYHVAFIAMLEGTVKNALLYWCPLIIHSLVSSWPPVSVLLPMALRPFWTESSTWRASRARSV